MKLTKRKRGTYDEIRMEKRRKKFIQRKTNAYSCRSTKTKIYFDRWEWHPNAADFSNRITALYSLAYSIKMMYKNAMKSNRSVDTTDFTVYPLEGLWKKVNQTVLDKSKLEYTLMIKQPDFITQEMFTNAMESVKKKKPNVLYEEISFREIEGGKAVQMLHIGSYDNEPRTFEQMDDFTRKLALTRIGDFHREIYLSNKNRTSEDKQKTILRYLVK